MGTALKTGPIFSNLYAVKVDARIGSLAASGLAEAGYNGERVYTEAVNGLQLFVSLQGDKEEPFIFKAMGDFVSFYFIF